MPPTEGKRVQLTIDYDLQKAVEDGFKAARRAVDNAGAAVVLDPAYRRRPAFTSEPAYDPNAFAAGIDRATWASLNTDEQRPLQRPRAAGPLFAGFNVQDGRGDRRRSRRA